MSRQVVLIERVVKRGSGAPHDPVRKVREYYTVKGEFVTERDPQAPRWCMNGTWLMRDGSKVAEPLSMDERG
jgi:ribosomal protein S27AE